DGAKAEFARHLGFARLLPAEGEVFRLADTAFRVQAEVPGLSIERGSEALPLDPGEAQPFASGDVLSGLGHRIRISLQISTRSEPIRGPKGGIVGYRAVREPNLVVAIPEPGEGPAARHRASTVTYLPVEGEPTVYGLAPDRPNRFYGGDDRIGPAGGEVVPMDLPDRELIALFERGFRQGTIYADRGFVRVLDRHAVRALLGELPEGAGDAYLASLPDAAVQRCILSLINASTFPSPSSGKAVVDYPITFTPPPPPRSTGATDL
ncbi:MAG: hypothetical protein HUU26_03395, partial [Gemmatimonadaceae bacterium]|nr:hypothetical protein [Gemmatimonadaceae bacterium]